MGQRDLQKVHGKPEDHGDEHEVRDTVENKKPEQQINIRWVELNGEVDLLSLVPSVFASIIAIVHGVILVLVHSIHTPQRSMNGTHRTQKTHAAPTEVSRFHIFHKPEAGLGSDLG
ncbi:hypothetical protein [Rubripirellula reticaptiva]|uniref:hypothetical protein n=1 Tax=Rubripirellula reticaptiva TaxID=2528013 RepID=UPI00164481EB|nr:hypothetical protein [Rubripirellula reticaptiva]